MGLFAAYAVSGPGPSIAEDDADFDADDYRHYGAALFQEKEYSEALTVIHKSLQLDEKNPVSHELLAEVEAQLGKFADAEGERKRAAELQQSK
jgi:Flp pilus assembly protein TadD